MKYTWASNDNMSNDFVFAASICDGIYSTGCVWLSLKMTLLCLLKAKCCILIKVKSDCLNESLLCTSVDIFVIH